MAEKRGKERPLKGLNSMGEASSNPQTDSRVDLPTDHAQLREWYLAQKRALPWRENRDPYRIWISEVMLQQTTVAAVIPYYERFLKRFPDVRILADAAEADVLEAWAGLGYYSRARNLHKAAKALAEKGFPRTAAELREYPGFGPYTAAAVASIAFGDPSGVLDGNVIRVLCRRYGIAKEWWTSTVRNDLQARADGFAQTGYPDEINQALMELGATVCTPSSPACLLCPWSSRCVARLTDQQSKIPLPRPRKDTQIWEWSPDIQVRDGQVALALNDHGPVLRGQWIFPGTFRQLDEKPDRFDARHGITHHDLYVSVRPEPGEARADWKWVKIDELPRVTPSRLLQKVLEAVQGK